jgi:hypothetical protein
MTKSKRNSTDYWLTQYERNIDIIDDGEILIPFYKGFTSD